jgi:hypothetical protein
MARSAKRIWVQRAKVEGVEKIPVWRTIGRAYGFAFGNLATIIGLIWLPALILLVGGYFVIAHYFAGVSAAIASGNRYAAYAGAGYFYLYQVTALLFEAIIVVPVMRLALGLRDKAASIHFAMGPAELRTFVALVAYTLIVATVEIAGFVLLFIIAVVLGYAAKTIGTLDGISAVSVAGWAILALLGVFFASIVYVTIRLSFLLVAVTVDEKRIDLIHAWELTHRNFWRALWVSIFVGTPVWLLYLGIQFAFVGFAAMVEATGVSPMTFQVAGLSQSVAARMHFMLAWLPYLYAAWFLVRPLAVGLSSGAAAAAYRALVPDAPAVSTPPADRLVPAAIG